MTANSFLINRSGSGCGIQARIQGPYSQHFLFFVANKGSNKLVIHYPRLERLVGDKHSSLLGPLERYEENEVL
jgi:hypothetical protein